MGEYKVSYKGVGKDKLNRESSGIFALRKIFFTLFAIFFFGSSFLSMLNISFTSLFSIDEITIEVGFPFTFLNVGFSDNTQNPLNVGGLILDLLIYALVAYSINIIANLIKESLGKNPNELAKEVKIPKKI